MKCTPDDDMVRDCIQELFDVSEKEQGNAMDDIARLVKKIMR